ncbi:glutathione S-transferase N-terminal domain-containing protein [Ruegeria sp. HKCCD8929]|uniref:glutathione S-transferase N-terminal domain-containing protein n=1 Tax=Ruegeria sp. HKCCD8929 TaxID=2683006 RepID=UPI001488635E|nr:glutathione S-transferase N-terminal domain-containing protein [Ruegeria sp. HKCCD8929]
MKLYVFETCPYCIRTRIIAGLKGLSPEIIHVEPGNIPEDLKGRIERLTAPILMDGETLIQDSTEIIRHFDKTGAPILSSYGPGRDLEDWRATFAAPLNALCYPRMPHLDVPELASPEARAFFGQVMPDRIGMPFAEALARTAEFTREVEAALPGAEPYLSGDTISFDTLATLADLQSLTMVAELEFPVQISAPFTKLMARAGVPPFPAVAA